jgi:serine phosphatase RsbU (regulator of sigma subunit)
VIDSILSAQTRHRNGEPADDDQTIIVIGFDQ